LNDPACERPGLANKAVEPEELAGCVARWAEDVRRGAPPCAAAVGECVHRSLDTLSKRAFSARLTRERRRTRGQDAVEDLGRFLGNALRSGRAGDRQKRTESVWIAGLSVCSPAPVQLATNTCPPIPFRFYTRIHAARECRTRDK